MWNEGGENDQLARKGMKVLGAGLVAFLVLGCAVLWSLRVVFEVKPDDGKCGSPGS